MYTGSHNESTRQARARLFTHAGSNLWPLHCWLWAVPVYISLRSCTEWAHFKQSRPGTEEPSINVRGMN